MACGNAIIATDVGDTRLFINKENGLLISFSLSELVNALEQLIQNIIKTRQMGLNGRNFVLKNHTIEKCANYYMDIFNKAYKELLLRKTLN